MSSGSNLGGARVKGDLSAAQQTNKTNMMNKIKATFGVTEFVNIFPAAIKPSGGELAQSALSNLRSISIREPKLAVVQQMMLNVCKDSSGQPVPMSFGHTSTILKTLQQANSPGIGQGGGSSAVKTPKPAKNQKSVASPTISKDDTTAVEEDEVDLAPASKIGKPVKVKMVKSSKPEKDKVAKQPKTMIGFTAANPAADQGPMIDPKTLKTGKLGKIDKTSEAGSSGSSGTPIVTPIRSAQKTVVPTGPKKRVSFSADCKPEDVTTPTRQGHQDAKLIKPVTTQNKRPSPVKDDFEEPVNKRSRTMGEQNSMSSSDASTFGFETGTRDTANTNNAAGLHTGNTTITGMPARDTEMPQSPPQGPAAPPPTPATQMGDDRALHIEDALSLDHGGGRGAQVAVGGLDDNDDNGGSPSQVGVTTTSAAVAALAAAGPSSSPKGDASPPANPVTPTRQLLPGLAVPDTTTSGSTRHQASLQSSMAKLHKSSVSANQAMRANQAQYMEVPGELRRYLDLVKDTMPRGPDGKVVGTLAGAVADCLKPLMHSIDEFEVEMRDAFNTEAFESS